MDVPFRVTLIDTYYRRGVEVFVSGLKATVTAVESETSRSNPQETEQIYTVTFDQPDYWIRNGLHELTTLERAWPADKFNIIPDDGVRPPGYVVRNNGDGENKQANMGGGRKTKKRRRRIISKTRKMKGGHHLYKRLGVSKYATKKTIKNAYNKLKKRNKLTSKVKRAYKILSKNKTRKQYNNKYKKHKKLKRKKRKRV